MFSASKLFFSVLAAAVVSAKSDFVPVNPVGNVAAVQSIVTNSDTRLYYQQTNGAIVQTVVTGPFTSGTSTSPSIGQQIVPPGQAILGTPIAACTIDNGTIPFNEIHVFFFSPTNVLSEYVWRTGIGFQGGANCSICVTQSGFNAVNGSQVLYAMENPNDRTVRVGFVSAGSPGTLSEAVRTTNGAWAVATLPNP